MKDIVDKIDMFLNEITFKKVIRKGKIKRRPICPDGFKAVKKGESYTCVKMKPGEMRKRSKSTRRAQKKIQAGGKAALLLRKRAKSMRKRDALIPTAKLPLSSK